MTKRQPLRVRSNAAVAREILRAWDRAVRAPAPLRPTFLVAVERIIARDRRHLLIAIDPRLRRKPRSRVGRGSRSGAASHRRDHA